MSRVNIDQGPASAYYAHIVEEKGNLDRLASGLSLEERRDLLEKLSAGSELTRAPLYEYALDGAGLKTAEQYAALSWFSRLWLFILSIFSGKPPRRLFEERQTAAMGREIASRWPGLYDYQQGMLLPAFYSAISALKNGARFFYTALDVGVNQDKGAFLRFSGLPGTAGYPPPPPDRNGPRSYHPKNA